MIYKCGGAIFVVMAALSCITADIKIEGLIRFYGMMILGTLWFIIGKLDRE